EITAEVVLATTGFDDPQAAIEAGITTILRVTNEHPLLHRLIRTEPESLLPLLISGDSPVVHLVRGVVEDIVRRDHPDLDDLTASVLADMGARLVVSYAVNPPTDPPQVVATSLARVLAGAAASANPAPTLTEPAAAEELS